MQKLKVQQSPYMTLDEVADYFKVDSTSVRRSRGRFSKLRRVNITDKRVLFYREDVEELDRELEVEARSPEQIADQILEFRKERRRRGG